MWLLLILRKKTDVEISHFTLAKVKAAAIRFSCGSTGFFPTKMGMIYSPKKINLN